MAPENSGVRETRYQILARSDHGKTLLKQRKDVPKAKNFSSGIFTQIFGQWPLNLFVPQIQPNRIPLHKKTWTNSITGRRKLKNNFEISHSRRNNFKWTPFRHKTSLGDRTKTNQIVIDDSTRLVKNRVEIGEFST